MACAAALIFSIGFPDNDKIIVEQRAHATAIQSLDFQLHFSRPSYQYSCSFLLSIEIMCEHYR